MTQSPMPYSTFSAWLRRRHGRPVHKIPLDLGGSCPNRDQRTNSGGCVFCNARGSGSGLLTQGLSLTEQWSHWLTRRAARTPNSLYLAYFQSFSNTFRPASEVHSMLQEVSQLPDIVSIAIGTRPDCLDNEKLDILANFLRAPLPTPRPDSTRATLDVWLELGLQSANDNTLHRINRGHDVASLRQAVQAAADRGLLVCLHVMHGLPGEGQADFLHTIDVVNALPVHAVKFHNTLVLEGSALARSWRQGAYTPPPREDVVVAFALGLARLRPDIVLQRLTADAWPGELLAPDWAASKSALRSDIVARMQDNAWQQGCLFGID